jgi:hypothetical protein
VLVTRALQNTKEPLPLDVQVEAIKRLEGVSLLLATLDREVNGAAAAEWRSYVDQALAGFEQGALVCGQPEAEFVDRRVRCDIFYNACCAFGLLHQFSGVPLDAHQSARLRFAFDAMKRLDHDGKNEVDLQQDSDFQTLRGDFWPPQEAKPATAMRRPRVSRAGNSEPEDPPGEPS